MNNNKAIKTYEDLLLEEQRLTAKLAAYKSLIQEDITGLKAGVKDKLNPVKRIKEKFMNLFSQEGRNGPAINFAINFVLDFIIRKFIPKRTSVWTKTIIPFITKNYVSHLITEEQRNTILKTVNGAIAKADRFIRKTILKKQREHFQKETGTPDISTVAAPGV